MIQDIAPHRFYNAYDAAAHPAPDSPVLCYDGTKVLLKAGHQLPVFAELHPAHCRYLFRVDDTNYFFSPEVLPAPQGYTYETVRGVRGDEMLPKHQRYAVLTGKHLADWYRDSRFCGRCGGRMTHDPQERAMFCPVCQKRFYPRIMPAVIIGVTNGDRLLLTKYRTGFAYYALVAGFTEIGETLEETVAREVMEETGLRVKNIRYYKSQPWGIANDILAGFYCDVDGDDTIRMDHSELKYAQWVKREEIILQPDDASLTNEMMQRFLDGMPC